VASIKQTAALHKRASQRLLTAMHCAHLLKEITEIFEQEFLLECCAGREGQESGPLEDTSFHELILLDEFRDSGAIAMLVSVQVGNEVSSGALERIVQQLLHGFSQLR
jgi:hypothetical protein